jgi:tetratricopeptide (TPR) repeat protein
MRKTWIILLFCSLFVFCKDLICLAKVTAAAKVKQANRLYSQEKFDEALQKYNEALSDKPDSTLIHFNSGTALYKKKDYEKAILEFTKALVTDNLEMEAASNYNIGNCKYRQGKLKINTDLTQAVQLYREALDYYKRAIELNQKNENAKFNHEFVEKELKILLDKLKQQPQQSKQKQQQHQKGSSDEQERQQQEQTQAAQVDSLSQQQQQEQQKAEAKMGEGEEEKTEQPQQQKVDEEQKKEGEMSEEEARMILEQYGREDRSPLNMQQQSERGYYPEVLKDW